MPDYCVKIGHVKDDFCTERLIRAKNEARALAHVVKDTITVSKASGDDYMRLAKAGVEVETAE